MQVETHIKPDFHSFFCGSLCLLHQHPAMDAQVHSNDIKFRQNIEFCHAKINKWQLVSGGLEKDFPTHWWASLTAGGHRWVFHDKSMASFTPRSTSHTPSKPFLTESLQQWLQTPVQTNYSVDFGIRPPTKETQTTHLTRLDDCIKVNYSDRTSKLLQLKIYHLYPFFLVNIQLYFDIKYAALNKINECCKSINQC